MENHSHNGQDADKIKVYNVIPTYEMTSIELTRYLSRPAINGEEFNVYVSDTGEYKKYVLINNVWKEIGGAVCGKMYMSSTQVIADSTITLCSLNTSSNLIGITGDTTNYRFTVTKSGYYKIYGQINFSSPVAAKSYRAYIYKNGSALTRGMFHSSNTDLISANISELIYLDVDDYIDLRCSQFSGGNITINAGDDDTFLIIHKI